MDTGKIKQRLNRHRKMVEDCEALRRELDFAIEKYGAVGGAGFDAIPGGSRTTGNGKIERQVIRKIELEERLSERELEVAADWRELEPLVNRLEPMEGLVIRLRYYYAAEWSDVCKNLYGKRDSFEDEAEAYKNRMFIMHGRALLSLAKLAEEKR